MIVLRIDATLLLLNLHLTQKKIAMEDNHQIINFAPSSSSYVMPLKKYDVFLSFRGEDTRDNFTSHLYDALQKEVETYIDYRLEKGDEISQALIKAIQDSLISVVIFSENYASSKWCLDEISMILQCKRDHGQIVIPVFYKVDPSDVRKQTGSYKEAFAKHEQHLKENGDDKLKKWRCALTEAANLAGWDYGTYRNESKFIKDIVKDVLQKLNITYPVDQLNGVVGIKENYAGIESLLELGSTEVVRVIGIWGMGGIGKTTLAHALYVKLYIQFEGHCFLKSVREQSEKIGLDGLRKTLFFELLREKNLQVESRYVMRRLARKKVLIVLDDVATVEQLEELIIDYNCLAPGSRVIVTTRNKHIFSQVNVIYKVKELNDFASLHLFCLNAFGEECPKTGYEKVSESVIAYCKGNPLALKVLGARLRSRSIEAWESELRKLRKIPVVNIHSVLKLSFDGLDSDEKDIFLDIACFLKGESRDYVTSFLDACGFYAAAGIENLIDKSLLTLSKDDTIEMHDLIQEMGRNVVRTSEKDPGKRSRLWDHEEVYDVLKNNKGTEDVECITLDVSKINKDLHLNSNSFTKMTEIRILKFYSSKMRTLHSWLDWAEGCKVYPPDGLESFPDKLRHLEWHGYCLESLPSTFCVEKLVKLVMSCSNLKKPWDGVLNVEKLKEIDLTCSKDLVELPDLSQATNLEELCLAECISLREVHPSILSLDKLWNLDLHGCTEIESLETEIHSKSLRIIRLSSCSSLKKFSVYSDKLEELWLDDTIIQELPSSIWRCEKLDSLSLIRCHNLENFGIGSKSSHDPAYASLGYLDLSGCKLVNESNLCLILDGMLSLSELYLKGCCNLRALPDSIGSLTSLKELYLSGSINVEMLSPNIKNLLKLRILNLDDCRNLVSLPELPPYLEVLNAINCTSLQTNFSTQLLPVVNRDGYLSEGRTYFDSIYAILPGSQVPGMMFSSEGDSITIPHLSGKICRFICCVILPYPPRSDYEEVECYINERYSLRFGISLCYHTSISDHLVLFSTKYFHSSACDPNSRTFQFSFRYDKNIKRCGVIPVYASQDQQQIIPTDQEEGSRPEKHIIHFDTSSAPSNDLNQTIEVSEEKDFSNNQVDNCSELVLIEKSHTLMKTDNPDWDPNEQCGSKRKAPSFKKEKSSRSEKHIIPFDTSSASNNDLNQTIEVSKEKDLSNNQVDNCSELVLFEKSHTLMEIDNPDWDPIGEIDSILSDSYKVSPMSIHSTCISEPKVKVILAKLETLLETSLEMISSNDEVKQQFLHVLEQLGRFEAEVPVRLHPVICKLKTLIEGFDVRFATSQKTIQDYDQLLQSRSLIAKQLESVKVQQDQIKTKVSELKMQFENINSEIGEQEKESSVLVEARERLKRELDHYDAESSKLKVQAAQWVPECKTIITDMKNSEPDYKVAVTNKKKYEDEWAQVKKNFVANEF